MNKVDWKGTAELIGLAAIVASLIFVGLQMQQDQEIAQAQAFVDASAVAENLPIPPASSRVDYVEVAA